MTLREWDRRWLAVYQAIDKIEHVQWNMRNTGYYEVADELDTILLALRCEAKDLKQKEKEVKHG